MKRTLWTGVVIIALLGAGLCSLLPPREASAQKGNDDVRWEYKVSVFSYNPGERLSDERRAAQFERTLNKQAGQGWEPVGSILTRDTIQTVGGAVTTRDTTSFVAFRRRR
jgi:hypothetical protein